MTRDSVRCFVAWRREDRFSIATFIRKRENSAACWTLLPCRPPQYWGSTLWCSFSKQLFPAASLPRFFLTTTLPSSSFFLLFFSPLFLSLSGFLFSTSSAGEAGGITHLPGCGGVASSSTCCLGSCRTITSSPANRYAFHLCAVSCSRWRDEACTSIWHYGADD